MKIAIAGILFFVLSLAVSPSFSFVSAVGLSPRAESEIEHLLSYLEKSGCEFYRNGVWYRDTKAARDHVTMKYHYFMKKGRIATTEDFIKWCATKSEMSGKAYMVRSGSSSPLPLAQWLFNELERYRRGTGETGSNLELPPSAGYTYVKGGVYG